MTAVAIVVNCLAVILAAGYACWRRPEILANLANRCRTACGQSRPVEPELRKVASIRLTPQHSIHLISLNSRAWLVGCHSSGVTVVGEPDMAAAAIGRAANSSGPGVEEATKWSVAN